VDSRLFSGTRRHGLGANPVTANDRHHGNRPHLLGHAQAVEASAVWPKLGLNRLTQALVAVNLVPFEFQEFLERVQYGQFFVAFEREPGSLKHGVVQVGVNRHQFLRFRLLPGAVSAVAFNAFKSVVCAG
jgi:hypothetical protein